LCKEVADNRAKILGLAHDTVSQSARALARGS
jgi:hypothetical protein